MTLIAKTTIEFSLAQIQEIIADYVVKKFPHCREVKAENVKFIVSPGDEDRMTVSSVPRLDSARVEILLTALPDHSMHR